MIQDENLSKAWALFDEGNYSRAEAIYKKMYAEISPTDHDNYWNILMGLVYVESFLEDFANARVYVAKLIACAINPEEKHIAIHQAGMIERMAGMYKKAEELFQQEALIIEELCNNDKLAISANLYEQGYVAMKLHKFSLAEMKMSSALEYAKSSNDYISMGCAYRGLGEIMKVTSRETDAIVYFEKSINAFESGGDTYGVEEVQKLILS